MLRARARGNRRYLENEREATDLVARLYHGDSKAAVESVRAATPAVTTNGISDDDEFAEHPAADAQILQLPKPVARRVWK